MAKTCFSLALTGSGGAGVMTAGQILLDAAARSGLYGLMVRSLGPQIRGGESAAILRIGTAPVSSLGDTCSVLVAVDWGNIERFADEIPLDENSLVIADPDQGEVPPVIVAKSPKIAFVPLKALADTVPGGRVNMIALGLAAALAGFDEAVVAEAIQASLGRKSQEVVDISLQTLRAGMGAATAVRSEAPEIADLACGCSAPAPDNGKHRRWLLSGNAATGLGILRGGVRYCAAYPITPATEVLEWLAGALPKVGGALVQAEDELASINMVVGGSFAGIPSMTATSGPGLSLMVETLGLAVAAEIPLVVCNVMRGGPSTGIPTKSEQSDLNIALFGLHGDAPHVVTAATDIRDCLFTGQWSVQLAEAMQTPVIMLTDQAMGQAQAVIEPLEASPQKTERLVPSENTPNYQRYAVTNSGVSPMAIPGMKGCAYTADGLEHSPLGRPSTQARDHQDQLDKRARKIEAHDYGDAWADIDGEGEIALLTFGSLTGVAREAAETLRARGVPVRVIALRLLMPLRTEDLKRALQGVRRVLVIEQNHSRQFLAYLKSTFDFEAEVVSCARPGPVPIRPQEIVTAATSRDMGDTK
ncbi:2-oxoacid:acceptor oxidoreductase subunit alpha [Phaeovibrio sulfidiphilus]|uniref:2-oxoacid:acceptor oxidoreductase subunit alpha n=1 Tax=Phaeovibrio sulfidiphilus TaxID=1220600 RepID=A0A8J6YKQ5_9PROT|nr:2-oxoacid:acceptor oxidoreductase subunit alpha [Phaeovibrio sulfidiphilus]MBE1236400.1 2-oxoacid:acceptor oxidoreductase subunit alpha [Phaeovibrio sulfidiphilus]